MGKIWNECLKMYNENGALILDCIFTFGRTTIDEVIKSIILLKIKEYESAMNNGMLMILVRYQ